MRRVAGDSLAKPATRGTLCEGGEMVGGLVGERWMSLLATNYIANAMKNKEDRCCINSPARDQEGDKYLVIFNMSNN